MKYEIELNEKKTEFIDEAVKEALELIYEVLNREQQTKYIAASELPKWGKTLSYVVQRALSYKANLFLKEKYTTNTMVEPPNQ